MRVWQRTLDTSAIAARASPRNPSVAILKRSSASTSLLVAWGMKATGRSSGDIPRPSSLTLTRSFPPRSTVTSTRDAPASIAFSSNSFMTLAGRSTTSPAAIWLMTEGGSCRIIPMPLLRDVANVYCTLCSGVQEYGTSSEKAHPTDSRPRAGRSPAGKVSQNGCGAWDSPRPSRDRFLAQSVFLELAVQGTLTDAEELGCLLAVALGHLQRLGDVVGLDLLKRLSHQ